MAGMRERRRRMDDFISQAVPPDREGIFTDKARRAGMSVQEYARKVLRPGSKATNKTRLQARFARNMQRIANRRKR